jgi:hypothetical protein
MRTFFDWEIAAVYLWAAIHDRPMSWASVREHWPKGLWRGKLPSTTVVSTRVKTVEVLRVFAEMERRVTSDPRGGLLFVVDGKPLLVGSHSKDPDAHWGHVRRGWAKGYKLHAIYGRDETCPFAWEITSLNEAEPEVAARIVPALGSGGGYLVGDSAYDSNPLHEATTATGRQLIAPRKRPKAGLGHRQHSRGRLRSIELLKQDFGRALLHWRDSVERQFGWLTNHGAGLAPLPNWVRRAHRVRLWVQAKLIIHAIYARSPPTAPPLAVG